MIGSVRADWPAPFSVIIGNPRADKLGRNGFECTGRRCLVDRERCVRATFMHSAIENYSMLHLCWAHTAANILANVEKYIRGKFARKWRI